MSGRVSSVVKDHRQRGELPTRAATITFRLPPPSAAGTFDACRRAQAKLREVIESGEIGQVVSAHASFCQVRARLRDIVVFGLDYEISLCSGNGDGGGGERPRPGHPTPYRRTVGRRRPRSSLPVSLPSRLRFSPPAPSTSTPRPPLLPRRPHLANDPNVLRSPHVRSHVDHAQLAFSFSFSFSFSCFVSTSGRRRGRVLRRARNGHLLRAVRAVGVRRPRAFVGRGRRARGPRSCALSRATWWTRIASDRPPPPSLFPSKSLTAATDPRLALHCARGRRDQRPRRARRRASRVRLGPVCVL